MSKQVAQDARAEIARLRQSRPAATWREIAARYAPVPAGTLARYHYDPSYEPRRPAYRLALGLPAEPPVMVRIQRCSHCGELPLAKRHVCPARKGEAKRRRLPPPLVRLVAGLLAAGALTLKEGSHP